MTRPSAAAVITAAILGLDAAVLYAFGVRWAALILAGAAAVALAAFWRAPLEDDDMLALVEATRECRCCSPEDYGACVCTTRCPSIRCTGGFSATAQITVPDHVPDEWTRENS